MTETPEQSEPQRLMPTSSTSDVKVQNSNTQNSKSCHKRVKRALDFSHMEGNDDLENYNTQNSISCYKPVQRVLDFSLMEDNGDLDIREEKIESSRASLGASTMLDMVNVIHSIFCSLKRAMTKEELLQKIIMNCFDFVHIGEVEEQLEILENLVPGWIIKKRVLSGDIMYCIKEVYDLDSIRATVSKM